MDYKYSKGSEWRKWDLHVHTPYSIEQHYGPSADDEVWEKYITDLENLPEDFKVLGINDYMFIDGYERLLSEKTNNGRLSNIDLLLPVVEFRVSMFAGVDFGQFKRINLHVIFSDDLSPAVIKSQFLNTLQQSYKLAPGTEGATWSGVVTMDSLVDLGASIKSNVPPEQLVNYGSDLLEGFRNLNLDEDALIGKLEGNSFLKGKYLLAVGKTEWDSLKWSDSSISSKKDIINKADLVFVASESVEKYKTAKEKLSSQSVNDLLLDCSDAHYFSDSDNKDRIGNCNTWIKSDPTFEGLRQVVFEPSRVAVHENQPDDKAGYQVIDRVEIINPLILNEQIPLNGNMNSIIGGRSTGKSVLLTAIAQKLKTEEPISFINKPDYGRFVRDVSSSLSVIWKDGEENDEREIEFFQQGYMYQLATNEENLSKLIQDILSINGKGPTLESYSTKKSELKKLISSSINDFFQGLSEINRRQSILVEKGDKKGVEDEIVRLEEKLNDLDTLSLSDDERLNYEKQKNIIETSANTKEQLLKDHQQIERLKSVSLVRKDVELEFTTISDLPRNKVKILYDLLTQETDKKWVDELEGYRSELSDMIEAEDRAVETAKLDPDYIKSSQAYQNSSQLKEIQDLIKEQKIKLNEIESISNEVSELKKKWLQIRKIIISNHSAYFLNIEELLPLLSSSQDGLDINAIYKFNGQRYRDILEGALNLQSTASRNIADFEYQNDEHYMEHLVSLFGSIVNETVTLKGGYTEQSLVSSLLTECFYDISYDLVYENDNFKHMSDGKKAFVVLKLLLDFSDKQCPILIDQPEDDLDNRAIYLDLVKYLEKKKVKRQIILATHNPNIVVGADSELVIVANQHGIKSENCGAKKFAYKTGSLENSKTFDSSNGYILESQGIREHVCDILEGGDIAFKLREKKYSISL